MKKQIGLLVLSIVFLYPGIFAQVNTAFEPECELPFKSIAVKRTIDDVCGVKGKGTTQNKAANELQNAAKNNFCATGTASTVKVADLVALHKKVKAEGITFGNYQAVPADRGGLQALGEGTKVKFTGYINEVKYANVSTGEGVNCKELRAENNDIHMELTARKTETNKCKRISAEISPHYRPDSWNVEKLKDVKEAGLKIRLTGQLFFDASHTSCADSLNDGYRASSWEIHPVYRIEIYVNSQWVDLHEWSFPGEDD